MQSFETVEDLKDIAIHDNGEPLVDFVSAGIGFAPRHPVFPFPRVHLLRQGVVERLRQAAARLPNGWTLVLVEGFRTVAVQRLQHEANRRRFLARYPDLPADRMRALLEDFSAPPDHPRVPPPHSTGGAMDVQCWENGREVDFLSPFTMDDLESAAWDAPVSDIARRNRERLKAALESAGITNYPGEWWHWSYGDQGWAHRGQHPYAVYGRLDLSVAEAEAIQGEPANREQPLRDWGVDLPSENDLAT